MTSPSQTANPSSVAYHALTINSSSLEMRHTDRQVPRRRLSPAQSEPIHFRRGPLSQASRRPDRLAALNGFIRSQGCGTVACTDPIRIEPTCR